MTKKQNVTPEVILKKHAAKLKAKKVAEVKNKNSATIVALDKPEGLYTHTMTCTTPGCGKTRRIKACDVFHARLCDDCRATKKKEGLKKFMAKVKDPVYQATKVAADRLKRLNAWIERTNAEVTYGFERLRAFQAAEAARPRLRRIWPQ